VNPDRGFAIKNGREINLDSILALDAEIIRLKRTRNSLLNVARMPPEILRHIFHFNILPEVGGDRFAGIGEGAYNFLFVCHHWFQVARRAPELWCSWGINLGSWKRWHLRSGISALDLVLDGWRWEDGSFDGALRDALRDRAARDVIREVHLRSWDMDLLASILSSLTPEDGGIRCSSMESIMLSGVDISDLFDRHHFPKLRDLHLSNNFKISSWAHLTSTTTALTDLLLGWNDATPPSTIPTTSQMLSLLASNPNIRSLTLQWLAISDDSGNGSSSLVPLCRLERLCLIGNFHFVFPILRRLELPERIDSAQLELFDCKFEEAYEIIGPYIRDYLQRDPRFRDRLEISASSTSHCTSINASTVGVGYCGPIPLPHDDSPCANFQMTLSNRIHPNVGKRLGTNVLALLSSESVVGLKTNFLVTEVVVASMPNLEALCLVNPVVLDKFLLLDPDGPNADKKLLPRLRRLQLEEPKVEEGNWSPLVTYLDHQTSDGQAVSLKVFGKVVHVCSDVVKQIEDLVEEFVYVPGPGGKCYFGSCL